MKLKNGIMWRLYRRAHGDGVVEHPRNLCRYFWTCVGGLLAFLFADLWFVILAAGLAAFGFGLFGVVEYRSALYLLPALTGLACLASYFIYGLVKIHARFGDDAIKIICVPFFLGGQKRFLTAPM